MQTILRDQHICSIYQIYEAIITSHVLHSFNQQGYCSPCLSMH
jgi:hypothetical protein